MNPTRASPLRSPVCPAAITRGATEQEDLENIADAIREYLEVAEGLRKESS